MATDYDLFFLAVADDGLRSALTARLGLAGKDVATVAGLRDPRLRPASRKPAVLVCDEAEMARHSRPSLQPVLSAERWRRIVMITRDSSGRCPDDARMQYIGRADAAPMLVALGTR